MNSAPPFRQLFPAKTTTDAAACANSVVYSHKGRWTISSTACLAFHPIPLPCKANCRYSVCLCSIKTGFLTEYPSTCLWFAGTGATKKRKKQAKTIRLLADFYCVLSFFYKIKIKISPYPDPCRCPRTLQYYPKSSYPHLSVQSQTIGRFPESGMG